MTEIEISKKLNNRSKSFLNGFFAVDGIKYQITDNIQVNELYRSLKPIADYQIETTNREEEKSQIECILIECFLKEFNICESDCLEISFVNY